MENRALKRRAVELLGKIPYGKVTTYKALAAALGTRAYRVIGSAMKCNPEPMTYSCFKVVKSDGSVGAYSGPGGVAGKIRRLRAEGIRVEKGKIVDFEKRVYRF